MGSIDRTKAYDIDVILNEKIYNPGDTIHGEIQFRLNRKLFCDTIIAQVCGIVKIFWTTNEVPYRLFTFGAILMPILSRRLRYYLFDCILIFYQQISPMKILSVNRAFQF